MCVCVCVGGGGGGGWMMSCNNNVGNALKQKMYGGGTTSVTCSKRQISIHVECI